MPLLRKELASKGADFLVDIQESLHRGPSKQAEKRHKSRASRVSVTIFYHETPRKSKANKKIAKRRRNFRRNS